MAKIKINTQLIKAIMDKTELKRAQIYVRIRQMATRYYLPNHLAAIKVAAEAGVAINKYASLGELEELRQAGSPVTPPAVLPPQPVVSKTRVSGRGRRSSSKPPNQVFVVHGRDEVSKDATFAFLRSVGVTPIEWTNAIGMTRKPSPYIGQILEAAFGKARAIVVLLTPDDQAQLRSDLVCDTDPPYEKKQFGQARPNVLFEAGMAFATHPDRTVLLQIGETRPFSDTAGRHVLKMSNDVAKRQEFVTKLQNAGCAVSTTGTDWLRVGDFSDPETRARAARKKGRQGRAR